MFFSLKNVIKIPLLISLSFRHFMCFCLGFVFHFHSMKMKGWNFQGRMSELKTPRNNYNLFNKYWAGKTRKNMIWYGCISVLTFERKGGILEIPRLYIPLYLNKFQARLSHSMGFLLYSIFVLRLRFIQSYSDPSIEIKSLITNS